MSLTPTQIDLIRASFEDIAEAPDDAASVFYGDLFRRAPEVRGLFVEDMERQGRKLINTLGAVVAQLDMLDLLVPMLRDLALRHVAYGVQPEDYARVGEALATMISTCCKTMPDPDCTEAWTIAYSHLAETMIALADEAILDGVGGAST
ncbi:MAG: globin domain-containing protein [Pseudomonadota bacterium]